MARAEAAVPAMMSTDEDARFGTAAAQFQVQTTRVINSRALVMTVTMTITERQSVHWARLPNTGAQIGLEPRVAILTLGGMVDMVDPYSRGRSWISVL